uniref:Periostin n=2 Tax=Anthurium amnicola TaxID=1678845 RepID=A0A1D1ZGB1_9ARAE
MALSRKKLNRGRFFVISFALVCLLLSLWCLLLLLNVYLPELPPVNSVNMSYKHLKPERTEGVQLDKLGEMMVAMLPDDLAFTIFVPSEKAFKGVLKLDSKESLLEQKVNETYAILSRVMSFSTVPQHLPSQAIPILKEMLKEMPLDSVSGFKLYAHRLADGTLIVNNVRAEQVDIRRGEIIVHIMNGVIMDAEFEQSFRPDYDE